MSLHAVWTCTRCGARFHAPNQLFGQLAWEWHRMEHQKQDLMEEVLILRNEVATLRREKQELLRELDEEETADTRPRIGFQHDSPAN